MAKLRSEEVRRRVVTLGEAPLMLGASRASVYRLLRKGELRAIRIGARQRIPEAEIARISGFTTP